VATLQDYLGITKLRDAWPKWKANVIAVNNQVINHVAGTADKHAAEDITYSGDFTGKTDVKMALDQAKTEIDLIVVSASIDPEVALARESSVKSTTFATLDARLEESEQDFSSLQADVAKRVISVLNPPAGLNRYLGVDVIADTTAIKAIIDYVIAFGGEIYFPKQDYNLNSIIISNANNVKISSHGGFVKHQSSENLFELNGNCNNVEICGFEYQGHQVDGVYDSAFIGNASGQYIDGYHIHHNNVHDCQIGISLNANLGGYVHNSLVEWNTIERIIGGTSGTGYGIHAANQDNDYFSNITVQYNIIRDVGRHSIYIARGNGYLVRKNQVYNHKKAINDNLATSCIALARSMNVICEKNLIRDCYNIGIAVSPDSETPENPYYSKYIIIKENTIINAKLGGIWLHTPDAGAIGFIEDITIENNTILQLDSAILTANSQGMRVYNCKKLKIINNRVHLDRTVVTSLQHCIILNAISENVQPIQPIYSDDWYIEGNICTISDGSGFGVRFNSVHQTMVKMKFVNNISNTTSFFMASSVVQNPNIEFVGQPVTALGFSAGVTPKYYMIPRLNVDSLKTNNSGFGGQPIQVGNTYLWVDTLGKLRIKTGIPTSDTDGVVVGTQT